MLYFYSMKILSAPKSKCLHKLSWNYFSSYIAISTPLGKQYFIKKKRQVLASLKLSDIVKKEGHPLRTVQCIGRNTHLVPFLWMLCPTNFRSFSHPWNQDYNLKGHWISKRTTSVTLYQHSCFQKSVPSDFFEGMMILHAHMNTDVWFRFPLRKSFVTISCLCLFPENVNPGSIQETSTKTILWVLLEAKAD